MHRLALRRTAATVPLASASLQSQRRHVADAVSWQSASCLPGPEDPSWKAFGEHVIEHARSCDSGPEAFSECIAAREQLEIIVREGSSAARDMNIAMFGGIVTTNIFETGGDVDFVAVMDVEPRYEAASEIVSQLSRDLRRLGLRASGIARARVPVIKVDRVSKALPGTPLHTLATTALFQFARPTEAEEQMAFDGHLKNDHRAVDVEWNQTQQFATVRFKDTTDLIRAITLVKKVGTVEIPLRLPLEPKHGPELFRYPFDLCLQSSGLLNTHLLKRHLDEYEYARHMLLFLKRWARSNGLLNSVEGLLASYCLTIMVTHFLVTTNVISKLDKNVIKDPQTLPLHPEYRALQTATQGDPAKLGYLTGQFLEYFANVFQYDSDVVCTTTTGAKKATFKWDQPSEAPHKPPFHHFAVKDPYNYESIGRNLDFASTVYLRECHQKSLELLQKELSSSGGDARFAADVLWSDAPRPTSKDALEARGAKSLAEQACFVNIGAEDSAMGSSMLDGAATTAGGGTSGTGTADVQDEARLLLKKVEFHNRKDKMQAMGAATVRKNEQTKAAQDLTRTIVSWIREADRHA